MSAILRGIFGRLSSACVWLAVLVVHPVVVLCLLQSRLVGGLPDLGQGDGTVEAMEDAQRQRDALDQRPGDEAVEVQLHLSKRRKS